MSKFKEQLYWSKDLQKFLDKKFKSVSKLKKNKLHISFLEINRTIGKIWPFHEIRDVDQLVGNERYFFWADEVYDIIQEVIEKLLKKSCFHPTNTEKEYVEVEADEDIYDPDTREHLGRLQLCKIYYKVLRRNDLEINPSAIASIGLNPLFFDGILIPLE